MRTDRQPSRIRLLVALTLFACGLTVIPPDWTAAIRAAVQDATLPGQKVARYLFEHADQWLQTWRSAGPDLGAAEALEKHKGEAAYWRQRCRRLEIQLALAREQMQRRESLGASPYLATSSERLFVPELLEARLVSQQDADRWRAALRLEGGAAQGIADEALVLEPDALHVDQGEAAEVRPGHPVYAGRCVIGKIAQVGRWTSSVLPVTNSRFRGQAQLIRQTTQGPVYGARGILEGRDAPLCGLKFVPADEVVAVGDHVYTADGETPLPEPLFYGVIVRAELKPGAPYWEIDVEPAGDLDSVQSVQILRQAINPARLMAN